MGKIPLTAVDAAWLHMEDPTNLMMVTGVMVFDRPLNMDHFHAILRHRFLNFRRFRQRVADSFLPLGMPHWEDDPNFDLNAHLRHVALPAPGDQAALQQMVSDLMSTPLDYSKPLWQFHLVENYRGGMALIGRMHHCLADGMALMQVLLAMTDLNPDAPWPTPKPDREKRPFSLLNLAYDTLVKPASGAFTAARQAADWLLQESVETFTHPRHLLDLAQQGSDIALATGRLLLLPPDPKTILKGKLGVSKKAAWSDPLPLEDIKAIKNVTGATVNDVLVSALAGGLRYYLDYHGEPVEGLNFRAFVPVNIRPPGQLEDLGNKFGLTLLSLPIYEEDPLERLMEVRRRMNALKNTPEAVVAFGILGAMGLTPADVQRVIVQIFAMKATAVMTNVPGPQIPLYMAGAELVDIMFWVPQSGRMGLGTSILSYADKVYLGVVTDVGLAPDPERIIEGFHREYEDLMALARLAQKLETPTADESG